MHQRAAPLSPLQLQSHRRALELDDGDDDGDFRIASNMAHSPAPRTRPAQHSRRLATPSSTQSGGMQRAWSRMSHLDQENTATTATTSSYGSCGDMGDELDDSAVGHHPVDPMPPPANFEWPVMPTVAFKSEMISRHHPRSPAAAHPPVVLQATLPRRLQHSAHTHQGQRKHNEDTYNFDQLPMHAPVLDTFDGSLNSSTFFAGVYDGHCGAESSTFAEHSVHEFLRRSPLYLDDMGAAMVDALRATDLALHESRQDGGTGTTAVLAAVRGATLTVANLGDSRAVLGTRDGGALQLTVDHKPDCDSEHARMGLAKKTDRIAGLGVSRAVGDFGVKDLSKLAAGGGRFSNVADVVSVPIDDDVDFLILASDGLWERVSNAEAVAVVRGCVGQPVAAPAAAVVDEDDVAAAPPVSVGTPRCIANDAAKDLVNLAVKRSTSDNVTAVVIVFHARPN